MAIRKFNKLDKITFNRWVDKVLSQSLTKQNIKGVKAHYVGPLQTRKCIIFLIHFVLFQGIFSIDFI
jgi:myo-inositol-1-phosphate synthase